MCNRFGLRNVVPRSKRVLNSTQTLLQLRIVPLQNGGHRIVLNPLHSGLAVNRLCEIRREKPIAIEPARSHQNKNAKCRVAEPESLGRCFREKSDDKVKA